MDNVGNDNNDATTKKAKLEEESPQYEPCTTPFYLSRSSNEYECSSVEINDQDYDAESGRFDYRVGLKMDGLGVNNDSYTIVELLGIGTYGQVFKTFDKKGNLFALKTVRNTEFFRAAGEKELKVLEELTRLDPKQDYVFSKLKCKFILDNHVCFGQRLLGMDLAGFWEKNLNQKFPISQIRHIIYQLAHTLKFLHQNNFVHTDIKFDNILFVDSAHDEFDVDGNKYLVVRNTRICLIDYGMAKFGDDEYTGIVSTRTWRAPEVFLKPSWDLNVDIWSLGCVLYKLFTGHQLFDGKSDTEQLVLMEETLGKFPDSMDEIGLFNKKYIKDGFIDVSKLKEERIQELKNEAENIKNSFNTGLGEPDVRDLIDLLRSMLKLSPDERISATAIMNHTFLNKLTTIEKLRHGICNEDMMVDESSGLVSGINCSCTFCDNYLKQISFEEAELS